MSRFKLPELEHRWAVLVVEMDRYDVFEAEYHQQDQALLKFVLSSILQESARHEGTDVWAEWVSEQRLYAILWLPETEHSEEMEARLLTDYLDRIGQYLNFTVTIGVGRVAVDLRGLRASSKRLYTRWNTRLCLAPIVLFHAVTYRIPPMMCMSF